MALGCCAGVRFDLGVEDLFGNLPADSPVRTALVVIGDEGVDLALQLRERSSSALLGQILLHGLVKALDLATRLGMVGTGVLADHPQTLELDLERRLPAPVLSGED